ncbi:MAG: hypothetical protein V3S89_10280 [Desulfobacterales bacterium]
MIEINRKLEPGKLRITDAFPTLRDDPMMLEMFGTLETVDEILATSQLKIVDTPHYMNVNNHTGTINVGLGHLRNSEAEVLYLDILHELYHVKQQREGADLYPRDVAYIDRPTEIESYEFTVKAARYIGLSDDDILNYLYVEWISPEDHIKLAERLNVEVQ